ncbi:NAD(P)-binding domain-containing protein [Acuticoccus kandeliae]|uniref:flavin-containing monooxygenase n=1 Tax=Acuticoccus kandeliae TaxID=2073160 RepID=UPI000D3E25ED
MLGVESGSIIRLVDDWLNRLECSIAARDNQQLSNLFLDECYWRDVVALSWRLQTLENRARIVETLGPALRAEQASGFVIDESGPPPREVRRVDRDCIEAFFRFETRLARARGIVRLCRPAGEEGLRAWTLMTELHELKGHEARVGSRRPTGQSNSRDFRGPNWLDKREAAVRYADRDPAVLVVGAGQAGLAVAARLTVLGVDTLVVERHARVGDNWRHRYHALTLHNQVQVNHLPYMPFPESWPTYIPKDKLAGWLEAYAEAMELNIWTGTAFDGAARDGPDGPWSVTLRRPDGTTRTIRPRHIVLATGVSGIANRAALPGLDSFAGEVLHSSDYRDGEDWAGKRAIVFGTGNSGHDIAQDLHSSGAAVTIVQRNPTLVVNIEPSAQLPYAFYSDGPTTDQCDLIAVSMPVPLVRKAHVVFTERSRALDKPLLDALETRGFRLDFGEDDTGWQFKFLTRGGGYYFNVGCSDLIAEGTIDLLQYDALDGFVPEGARLKDGRIVAADLVVLSTGYKGQEHLVARLFGDAVAARVGPIWGFGEGLELRNMFTRTPQEGLWFIAGSLAQCRIYSKYLALQIKACEVGLMPEMPRADPAPAIAPKVAVSTAG